MNDFQALGLEKGAPLKDVKMAYIALAKLHHPDVGGDAEKFVTAQKAYARLVKQLTTPRVCDQCNGVGVRTMQTGFTPVVVTCPNCKGLGRVNER